MVTITIRAVITGTAFLLFFISCSLEKKIAKSATATVLNAPALATAHVGISIYEPATGKRWYDFQGDKYFVPASNTKIPTCYAAMKYLGDSLTGLMYGDTDEPGKLYIKGTGDPTFLHPDFKNQPVYDFLKKQNKPLAVTNANFFAVSLGSGWAWNDYNENYMAERSALPVYGNIGRWKLLKKGINNIDFDVSPSLFRDSLRFIYPDFTGAYAMDTIKRSETHIDIRRKKDANVYELVVANTSFNTAEIPFETTNPATLAAILRDTLRLPVETKTKYYIYSRSVIKSQPTDSMLMLMMHRSDNFFAEQSLLMVSNTLLGVMSDRMVVDTLLKTDLKDLPQKPRWADGSGLSRYNLFTPQDFVAILQKMKNEFGMERIKVIFPTGGEGTISSYYKTESGYIYAKTGTLSGVVALSGYLVTKKNKELIFSVLVNNHQASATDVRRAVEKFLQYIRNQY
jgi:serine-type D-Ala-D-Ala carboxypeptidase/endopeptidase (penicillin-binding protein 4)